VSYLQSKSNNTSDGSNGSNGKATNLVGASTASDWNEGCGRGDASRAVDDGERVGVGGSWAAWACRGLDWACRGGLGGLGATGVEDGGGWLDWLDNSAWAVGDGDCRAFGQGVGVGVAVVGDGSIGWADSGINIDNLSGVDDGVVALTL